MGKSLTYLETLKQTDPEFVELFKTFAGDEVINEEGQQLDPKDRYMAILATILGCQGTDLYREILPEALDNGVTPIEVKEIVYQAVAYVGMGRIFPFLKVTNEVLAEQGVELPLPNQRTVTAETRLAAGQQAQADIFGGDFQGGTSSGNGPSETGHIDRWLSDNCFGDYFTRRGLDFKQREMITFCFLSALGTEPQLKVHVGGNVIVGNDRSYLIRIASQCMPYAGYPRTLNALRCIKEALADK